MDRRRLEETMALCLSNGFHKDKASECFLPAGQLSIVRLYNVHVCAFRKDIKSDCKSACRLFLNLAMCLFFIVQKSEAEAEAIHYLFIIAGIRHCKKLFVRQPKNVLHVVKSKSISQHPVTPTNVLS